MGKSKNLERRNTHSVKDEVSILRIFQKKLKFNIGKYFAKWISKSWKTQKLIITVRNLFNWYVYSYQRFAEEVIEVLLFLTLCSCHVTYAFQSQSTLYSLPECQGTPCSKQARNLKFKWLQLDTNPEPLSS